MCTTVSLCAHKCSMSVMLVFLTPDLVLSVTIHTIIVTGIMWYQSGYLLLFLSAISTTSTVAVAIIAVAVPGTTLILQLSQVPLLPTAVILFIVNSTMEAIATIVLLATETVTETAALSIVFVVLKLMYHRLYYCFDSFLPLLRRCFMQGILPLSVIPVVSSCYYR